MGKLGEGLNDEMARAWLCAELAGIPQVVLRSRAMILGPMVLGISAQYERMVNDDAQQGNWESLGYFLVDSIVGMLAAPSTAPVDSMDFNEGWARTVGR